MNHFESHLADRLHDLVDDEAGGPPTEVLLARGRRARLRRRTVVVSAALVVLTVGAGVASTVGSGPSQPSAATDTQPATVRLAAAIAASDNISYRVRVTASPYGEPVEGAFDPATRTGYLNETSAGGESVYYERLIDGVRYVSSSGSGDVWKQYPGTHDRLAYDQALGGAASASADPAALFDGLRQAGATITENSDGVFHFEVTLDNGTPSGSLVGDVTLGADGRIASVTYEETTHFTKGSLTETSAVAVTVELSDYGTPVQVEQPTDVVVVVP